MQHAMTSLSVARLGVQRQAPQPASRSQPARSAAAAVTCSMRQADGTSTGASAAMLLSPARCGRGHTIDRI